MTATIHETTKLKFKFVPISSNPRENVCYSLKSIIFNFFGILTLKSTEIVLN